MVLMSKKHLRVRCPYCGALTWESQWNRIHPIEIYEQIYHGGKGKRNAMEYHDITNERWVKYLRNVIIQRCLDILHWLNYESEPIAMASQSPSVSFYNGSALAFSQMGDVVFR